MTTKAEHEWMDAITRLGCIVCYLEGHPETPACVHHLTSGGRRISHLKTIPLCNPGHHKDVQRGSGKTPFHHNKRYFQLKYGTEEYLLDKTQTLVGRKERAAA